MLSSDDPVDQCLLHVMDGPTESGHEQRGAARGGDQGTQPEQEVRIALFALGEGTGPGEPVDYQQAGLFLHKGLREQVKQRRQPFLGSAVAAQEQEGTGDHRPVEEVEPSQVIDQPAMGLGEQRDDDDPFAAPRVGQPALEAEDGLAGAGMALHEV